MNAIAAVCLVLLLDSSGSITTHEWNLQLYGTAEAISSPEVVSALRSQHGTVMFTVIEWAWLTFPIVPWSAVSVNTTEADAKNITERMKSYERRTDTLGTAVGKALQAAIKAIETGPRCSRYVIDISSDGINNAEIDPRDLMEDLIGAGIQVNALVIENPPPPPDQGEKVTAYYRGLVNGFVMSATWDGFALAIRRKLVIEIASASSE